MRRTQINALHVPWDSGSYFLRILALTKWAERHVARHKQKDEEAGAEGCGILNTRKNSRKLIICSSL